MMFKFLMWHAESLCVLVEKLYSLGKETVQEFSGSCFEWPVSPPWGQEVKQAVAGVIGILDDVLCSGREVSAVTWSGPGWRKAADDSLCWVDDPLSAFLLVAEQPTYHTVRRDVTMLAMIKRKKATSSFPHKLFFLRTHKKRSRCSFHSSCDVDWPGEVVWYVRPQKFKAINFFQADKYGKVLGSAFWNVRWGM